MGTAVRSRADRQPQDRPRKPPRVAISHNARCGSGPVGNWVDVTLATRFDSRERGRSCHLRRFWAAGMAPARRDAPRRAHRIPADLLPLPRHRRSAERRLVPHRAVARAGAVRPRLRRDALPARSERANRAGRVAARPKRFSSRREYGHRRSRRASPAAVFAAQRLSKPVLPWLDIHRPHSVRPSSSLR